MFSNILHFRALAVKYNPLLICVSEARVTAEMANNLIEIQNYKIFRCNSLNRHTGGVIFYVKESVVCVETSNICKSLTWFLSIKITKGPFAGNYGLVYKSPNEKGNFNDMFEDWCEGIVNVRDRNFIFGDFNVDVSKNSKKSKDLLDVGNGVGLKQIVNAPTREDTFSSTIIDLIFTNCDNIDCVVDNINNFTDHNILFLDLKISKSYRREVNLKSFWSWKNYSRESLVQSLFCANYSEFENCDNLDFKAECLINLLSCAVHNLLSFKTINCDFFNLGIMANLKKCNSKLKRLNCGSMLKNQAQVKKIITQKEIYIKMN